MGYPVYISKNKTAYGYVSGLGTKFYTVFQDGTLLVSKAYIDGDYISGPMIRKYAKKASIGETWADHQQRIAELEAEGKRVDRQTSFKYMPDFPTRKRPLGKCGWLPNHYPACEERQK